MRSVALGVLAAFLLAFVVVGGCTWATRNGLVSSRNAVDKTWGDVSAAYQRRLDTIPKFVETAKFSVKFQKELALEYAKAREQVASAAAARNPDALQATANDGLTALVVAVRVEAVPAAKLDQLTELNAEIENVERVINHERKTYNDACRNYKNNVQGWPGAWVAGWAGFSDGYCQMFGAQPGAEKSPEVKFD